mgnify:CR=1 FL=1
MIRAIIKIGLPTAIGGSTMQLGTLIMTRNVNVYGYIATSAYGIGNKINSLITMPASGVGSAVSTIVGQNMGAGKPKRIGKGLLAASLMGFGVSAVLFVIVLLFGKPMTLLFLSAKEVKAVKYAYQYMIVTTAGYSLLTLVNTVRFTIQGMGYSAIAILAGGFEMAARTLAGTLVVSMIGFMGVCMANDLAWIFADAFLIPVFFVLYRRAKKQYQ